MRCENRQASKRVLIAAVLAGLAMAGCGSKEQAAPQTAADATAPATQATDTAAPDAGTTPAPLAATDQTWTPEEMEALLAPIALYPDPVLSQVLLASTNPQEVLDAGNWLVGEPRHQGQGARPGGREGRLYATDARDHAVPADRRPAVPRDGLDDRARPGVYQRRVRRVRRRATAAYAGEGRRQPAELRADEGRGEDAGRAGGNRDLAAEPGGRLRAAVRPGCSLCAACRCARGSGSSHRRRPPRRPRPRTTKGHSTGSMMATGLLAFGAGLVVANIFDDDDDDYYHNDNYYPNYHGGYMPPPPPYYYRPVYGNGYHPNSNYNRPTQYNNVLREQQRRRRQQQQQEQQLLERLQQPADRQGAHERGQEPDHPGEAEPVGAQQQDAVPTSARTAQRPSSTGAKPDWKGQSSYAGAKPEVRAKAKLPESKAATSRQRPTRHRPGRRLHRRKRRHLRRTGHPRSPRIAAASRVRPRAGRRIRARSRRRSPPTCRRRDQGPSRPDRRSRQTGRQARRRNVRGESQRFCRPRRQPARSFEHAAGCAQQGRHNKGAAKQGRRQPPLGESPR